MKISPNTLVNDPTQAVVYVIFWLTIVTGSLVLIGWFFDVSLLKSVIPGANTMKVNTALGFIFSGMAFLLTVNPKSDDRKSTRYTLTGLVCTVIVLLIGLLTISEHASGLNLGIDVFLIKVEPNIHAPHPGRMSLMTALSFSLLGLILLLRNFRKHFINLITLSAAVSVLGISTLAILGYLYHSNALWNIPVFSTMALHTALLFALLSIGAMLDHPQQVASAWRYAFASVAVLSGFGLRLSFTNWFGPGLPTFVIFYPAIILVALISGFGPALLATILSVLVTIIWLFEPIGLPEVDSPVQRAGLVLYFATGVCLSYIIKLYQNNRQKAADYDRDQALRASRQEIEFLGNILEHASQPFAVGFLDGRLGRVNPAFEALTGYSSAELQLLDWATVLTPPEWRTLEQEKLDELLRTGQPVRYEKEYIRKDGSRVPIELLAHVFKDAQGNPDYLFGFVTDITERKSAEAVLRESEERYRSLFDGSLDAIFSIGGDGRFVRANYAALRLAGKTQEEMMALHFLDLCSPDQREHAANAFRAAFCRQCLTLDTAFIDAKGARREIFISGAPAIVNNEVVGVSCIARDMTERNKAETALRQSEHRYRQVTESLPQLVWTCDSNGVCDYLSPQWCTYTGIPESLQLGTGWLEQLHPDDSEPAITRWKACAAQGIDFSIDYRIRGYDGKYRWFHSLAVPLRDERDAIVKWFGSNTDIQDIKEAEAKARESDERLNFALKTCQIGAWDLNLDDMTVYRSLEHAHIFGYSDLQNDWTPNRFLSHVLEEDREAVEAKIQEAMNSQGTLDLTCQIRRVDGKIRWIWVNARKNIDATNHTRRIAGIVQDITEYKHIEDEKERLLTIIQENPDFIGVSDMQGKLLYHNPAALKMVGLPADTDMEQLAITNMHPDWAGQLILNEGIPTALRTGSWHSENALLHRDGREIPVDQLLMVHRNEAGEAQFLSTIMHDISESKRLERRFEQALESAPNAIVIIDEFGIIQIVNLQAESYFGYSRHELLGQPIEMLIPERFRADHVRFRQGYFLNPITRPMGLGRDLFALRKDGSELPVEIGVALIQQESGLLVMSSIVDITERKLANTRLQDALRQKDLLLKEVYHRVKNNLQVVSSLINLQAKQVKNNKDAYDALLQSANRVKSLALIHEKLYQAEDLERIDFKEYCQSLVDHLVFALNINSNRIKISINVEQLYLDLDTVIPLGLIINELLSNALNHAFPDNRPGEVGIHFTQEQSGFCLVFKDNGIGLPSGLDYTNANSLGLTLIFELSEQLSGSMKLEQTGGTTYTLHFSLNSIQKRL
jgi:PAS domain S-box-containing protein